MGPRADGKCSNGSGAFRPEHRRGSRLSARAEPDPPFSSPRPAHRGRRGRRGRVLVPLGRAASTDSLHLRASTGGTERDRHDRARDHRGAGEPLVRPRLRHLSGRRRAPAEPGWELGGVPVGPEARTLLAPVPLDRLFRCRGCAHAGGLETRRQRGTDERVRPNRPPERQHLRVAPERPPLHEAPARAFRSTRRDGVPHAGRDPNYWAYADRFVLQDRMFAPADSWTLPAVGIRSRVWRSARG